MNVLICGGRDYEEWGTFTRVMAAIAEQYFDKIFDEIDPNTMIISGGARGADEFAIEWASMRGFRWHRFEADWDRFGKRAGVIRNKEMLEEGEPDLVVAFPGGKGTTIMVGMAGTARVPIIEVNGQGEYRQLNFRDLKFKTAGYQIKYMEEIAKLPAVSNAAKRIVLNRLLAEEAHWLENMGKDYYDIMGHIELYEKLNGDN